MSLVSVEPIWQPLNQQKGFRGLLDAMSYPGRVVDLAEPLAGSRAELGVLACLVDEAVAFADPTNRLTDRERGMLGAPCIPFEKADFVVHNGALPPPADFEPRLGDLYRPDRGATLILCGERLGEGPLVLRLEGPGVETFTELRLTGFDRAWIDRRAQWVSNFPIGVDLFLCDAQRVVGLPRTCRVKLILAADERG